MNNEVLQSVIDDKLYFTVDLTKSQEANVYLRESKYSYYESAYDSKPKENKFFRVEKIDRSELNFNVIKETFNEVTNSTVKSTNLSNYLVKIHIRLEDRVDMFEVSGL